MKHSVLIGIAVIAAAGCMQKADKREVASATVGDTTVAPSAQQADRQNQTLVRVVNAVPGNGAVDLKADDQPMFNDVKFKGVTAYQAVTQNRPHFKLTSTGVASTSPLAENTEMVMDGRYYTVVAMIDEKKDGEPKDIKLQPIRDDLTPANPAKARIRVINAASRSEDIDVRIEADKDALFTDLDYKGEAGFKDVEPGSATFIITGKDGKQVLLRMAAINLAAGQSLTLVLTHPSATSTKIEAIQVMDELKTVSSR